MRGSAKGSFGGLLQAGPDTGWGHVHVLMCGKWKIHLFAFHSQQSGVFDHQRVFLGQRCCPKLIKLNMADMSVIRKNSTRLYLLSHDPGVSFTSRMTPCMLYCLPLFGKQQVKNSGNLFGRNDVKLLAQVPGACPVEEICVFLLFWHFRGLQTFYVTFYVNNCADRKLCRQCFQISLH